MEGGGGGREEEENGKEIDTHTHLQKNRKKEGKRS